jgi:MFS family permease
MLLVAKGALGDVTQVEAPSSSIARPSNGHTSLSHPSAGPASSKSIAVQGLTKSRAALYYGPRKPSAALRWGGANVGGMLAFYILITYVIAYGSSRSGLQLPRSTMLSALLIAQVVFLPSIIVAGTLSDRIGRRRMFIAGVILLGIWGFILFPMIETRSLLWITAAISIGLFFVALIYGPLAAMFAELFDTRVRYCAVSLAYQISAIVGGALAPMIATGLYARYHSNISISIYMATACVLSLICVSMLNKAHETDLDEHAHPAIAEAIR